MKNKSHYSREIHVNAQGVTITGDLIIPENAHGVVIFAHGSGSSRFSPRNKYVAEVLNKDNIATLLIDLLSPQEEEQDILTREYRFDIELLAGRLVYATRFVQNDASTKDLAIGYFGSSTGAAAAIVAAVKIQDSKIKAVVSRGGRPDLAEKFLEKLTIPTLLLVGGKDYQVIDLNKMAMNQLTDVDDKELVLVSGATHLFEEPGTLETVAIYAKDWFKRHL